MASIPTAKMGDSYGAKTLCLIVGLACLAGFLLELLTIGLPPNVQSIEWRINFLEQIGSRGSLLLLVGSALCLYTFLDNRRVLKQLALACLVIGVVFHLSCVILIRDGLTLRDQTLESINARSSQLQTQLEGSSNSVDASSRLSSAEVQQAARQIADQTEALKQETRLNVLKALANNLGNLVIAGLALIGLGRFGLSRS